MDAKALLRARMREAAQKREKRIDSPLVRYNELGQPVCKVCNVAVKSETLWPAHLASRSHKEAVEDLKARARPEVLAPSKVDSRNEGTGTKARLSSSLPMDFFDTPSSKKPQVGDTLISKESHAGLVGTTRRDPENISQSMKPSQIERTEAVVLGNQASGRSQEVEEKRIGSSTKASFLPEDFFDATIPDTEPSAKVEEDNSMAIQKGLLPEGFFDNVDADHRARGLKPPKHDMQEELKEFQKAIKGDLEEADHRLEEDEYDAAEEREEREHLERRSFLQRIEHLHRIRQNKLAAVSKAGLNETISNMSADEDSESDEGSEEDDFLVDWRAKQL